jgi:hypothetical protein
MILRIAGFLTLFRWTSGMSAVLMRMMIVTNDKKIAVQTAGQAANRKELRALQFVLVVRV